MADRSAPRRAATSDDVDIELAWSPAPEPRAAAVVTHPHPLTGGDMHNPVDDLPWRRTSWDAPHAFGGVSRVPERVVEAATGIEPV